MSAAAVALAACGTTSTTASQLATDVSLIACGLASAITAIAAIPGVPAATVTQLQGYLTTIKTDAAAVAAATPGAGAATVQEIASTVQTVADIALPLIPGGSAIVPIVNAAVSLLPTILAAAGVTGATKTPPVYTPDQARLILRALAGK
jgi:phage-related protein